MRSIALKHGRRPGQPGHAQAREYLLGRMKQLGLVPFRGTSLELPYKIPGPVRGEAMTLTNLVGVIPGRDRTKPPILIGAHYDSVLDGPCADDNAAAVAATLAVAEAVSASPLSRDVVVALFDAEEPPFFNSPDMGSIRFVADHCQGQAFACAIVMDLVGHDVEVAGSWAVSALPQIKDLLFVMGCESDQSLPAIVEKTAADASRLRVIATLDAYVGDMSDHAAFRKAGHPFLFLSCGQGKYYHQQADDMKWINLAKVGRVAGLVRDLAIAVDHGRPDGPARPCDPIDTELRLLNNAMGPLVPWLLRLTGIEIPKTRSDVDKMVMQLRSGLRV